MWQKLVEPEPVKNIFQGSSQVGEEEDWVVGIGHDDGRREQETGFDLDVVFRFLGK